MTEDETRPEADEPEPTAQDADGNGDDLAGDITTPDIDLTFEVEDDEDGGDDVG